MDINDKVEHIPRAMFLKLLECDLMKPRNKEFYIRIHNRVKKEWQHPSDWYSSHKKTVKIESRSTDMYWSTWSIIYEKKLPIDFIKQMNPNMSKKILRNTLLDYEKFEETINKMEKEYKTITGKIYSIVLKTCISLGINDLRKITLEDMKWLKSQNIFSVPSTDTYRLFNLLYYMGYRNSPPGSILHERIKANMKTISSLWGKEMIKVIEEFLDSIKNNLISTRKGETEKINNLNIFAKWYTKYKAINMIDDFTDFKRQDWLEYIDYISQIENISNKTKSTRLLALVQLIEWLHVKRPNLIVNNLIVDRNDYRILNNHHKKDNWAFEKREHGEKILKYLLYDFKPKRIEDMYKRDALIFAANSGMRISEIRNIPYNSCIYSEDEEAYKIILEYEDKVGQENRPCYVTADGFKAIQRLENLRVNNGNLLSKYNKEVEKEYIHLFEYRGKNPINHTALDAFIQRIKRDIGLIDENDQVVKGGAHAFRHFFSMTVFRASGYNIGVVRYLLGHRKYDMSYQYLEEDMNEIISRIRNRDSNNLQNYGGKGVDTIVDILIGNNNAKEYYTLKRVLQSSKTLIEVLDSEVIAKVTLGYCLNPCGNEEKCRSCVNFLITEKEKDKIFKIAEELFSFICYKVSIFKSKELALKNISIQKDIAELYILIEEMKNLDINAKEFYEKLKRVEDI